MKPRQLTVECSGTRTQNQKQCNNNPPNTLVWHQNFFAQLLLIDNHLNKITLEIATCIFTWRTCTSYCFNMCDHWSLALPWSSLFNWFTATETLSNRKAALSVELDGTRALRHNLQLSVETITCTPCQDLSLVSVPGWLPLLGKACPNCPRGWSKSKARVSDHSTLDQD